jgi:hypothetical protein
VFNPHDSEIWLTKESFWTCIGALVTVLMLFFGPFSQQAVEIKSRNVVSAPSFISRAASWTQDIFTSQMDLNFITGRDDLGGLNQTPTFGKCTPNILISNVA